MDNSISVGPMPPEIYSILILDLFRSNPGRTYRSVDIRTWINSQFTVLKIREIYPVEFEHTKTGKIRWKNQLVNSVGRLTKAGCLHNHDGMYEITSSGLNAIGTLHLAIYLEGNTSSLRVVYKLGKNFALSNLSELPKKLIGLSRYRELQLNKSPYTPQLLNDVGWPYIGKLLGKSLD